MMNEMMENAMEETELSEEQMENVAGGIKNLKIRRRRRFAKNRPTKNEDTPEDNNGGEEE